MAATMIHAVPENISDISAHAVDKYRYSTVPQQPKQMKTTESIFETFVQQQQLQQPLSLQRLCPPPQPLTTCSSFDLDEGTRDSGTGWIMNRCLSTSYEERRCTCPCMFENARTPSKRALINQRPKVPKIQNTDYCTSGVRILRHNVLISVRTKLRSGCGVS